MRKFLLSNLGSEALISPIAVAMVLPGDKNTCNVYFIGRQDPLTIGVSADAFADWLSLYWPSERHGDDEAEDEEEEGDASQDEYKQPAASVPLPEPPAFVPPAGSPSPPPTQGAGSPGMSLADSLKKSAAPTAEKPSGPSSNR